MSALSSSAVLRVPRPSRLSANLLSRLRGPDIDVVTVGDVLAHYGLVLAGAPRNLPNARRNRNLIVTTSDGRRVLKLYRRDWRTATIAYEHSILRRLTQIGFPAPRLAVTIGGTTYLSRLNDNYAVFDFVEGDNYSSSFLLRPHRMRLMATAGETLARLHQALRGFLPEGEHHLGFKSLVDVRHRDIVWHVDKVAELREGTRGLTEPQDRLHGGWLADHGDQILEQFARTDEALGGEQLPRVIIHGDYGLHNLIFQGPGRATPVDFELARLEWRLCDLVSVISKFRYRGLSYDFGSIRQFMRAYQEIYPIPREEWALFPLVWKHYKLAKAVQYWSSYFETGGPTRKLLSARDAVDQSTWAASNPGVLAELRPGS